MADLEGVRRPADPACQDCDGSGIVYLCDDVWTACECTGRYLYDMADDPGSADLFGGDPATQAYAMLHSLVADAPGIKERFNEALDQARKT